MGDIYPCARIVVVIAALSKLLAEEAEDADQLRISIDITLEDIAKEAHALFAKKTAAVG
jgi:hypothetical protein